MLFTKKVMLLNLFTDFGKNEKAIKKEGVVTTTKNSEWVRSVLKCLK